MSGKARKKSNLAILQLLNHLMFVEELVSLITDRFMQFYVQKSTKENPADPYHHLRNLFGLMCMRWNFWQLEGVGRILESAEWGEDPLNALKDVLVEYYKKRSETQVGGFPLVV